MNKKELAEEILRLMEEGQLGSDRGYDAVGALIQILLAEEGGPT